MSVYGRDTVDPLARLELAARLRRGIERGELELHHQPILRLADRGVIGVESLVRWRDPSRDGSCRTASIRAASCSRSRSRRGRSRPRGCCPSSASCARPASYWPSTTSGPATRRCGACASSRCRSSRSTGRSCAACRTTRRRRPPARRSCGSPTRAGCDVVADGVEDASHAAFLEANGCRIGQGFHFSRPVPAAEATALLCASVASDRRR